LQWDVFLIVLFPDQSTNCGKYDNGLRCEGRTMRYRDILYFNSLYYDCQITKSEQTKLKPDIRNHQPKTPPTNSFTKSRLKVRGMESMQRTSFLIGLKCFIFSS